MTSSVYMNPYFGKDIFEFFLLFFSRLFSLVKNGKFEGGMAADEIQVFVLIGVATSAAIVGSFLILRRMAMLANSLSHTILLGIVVTYMILHRGNGEHHLNISAMLFASVIMGIVTTFLTEFLTKGLKLQEDASIGIVFSTLFSLGILLVSAFAKNAHIGIEVVMGNVDSLDASDLKLVFVALAFNCLITFLCFKEFKISSFDIELSNFLGISSLFFNYLLMIQVSTTAVAAFRAVGVLMVLAFIIGPPLIARMLTDKLKSMIAIGIMVGVLASLIGVGLSRHFLSVYDIPLSTGGVVVSIIGILFFMAAGYSKCISYRLKKKLAAKAALESAKP